MRDIVIFLIHLTLLLLLAFYITLVCSLLANVSKEDQITQILKIQNDQLAQKCFNLNFYFIYMQATLVNQINFITGLMTQYWQLLQQNCAIQKTVNLLGRSNHSQIIGRGQTHRQRMARSQEKSIGYVMYMYIIVIIYHFIQYAALHT